MRLGKTCAAACACWLVACGAERERPAATPVAAAPAPAPEAAPALGEEGVEGAEIPALRLLIETRAETRPEEVAARLEGFFGAPVRVERLFPEVDPATDPEGMSRMFLARVPRRAGERSWDTANAVRAELDFTSVAPDEETVLEEGIESVGTCQVETPPPADHRWSLVQIRAPEAWLLEPPAGGRRFGEGVRVCHPDTGWSDHLELDAARLDLAGARNLLADGTADAKDPLDYDGGMLSPGHGTATGTVIVSPDLGEIGGVAPAARLVPIRTAHSVVQVFDSDLARAVNHAVDVGCDVLSMSLGGRGFFGLKAAIERAVRNDLLVMAAAGNCVGFVVAPACYPDTLAVGGSSLDEDPWPGSSRGPAVAISAPAEQVWTAKRRVAAGPFDELYAGQGTSFAVANLAGSAALWLAFHDPAALRERYGEGIELQQVFRRLARETARVPPGWDAQRFGAGILDVAALLAVPLPDPAAFDDAEEGEEDPRAAALVDLARVVGRSPAELRLLVAELFQTGPDEALAAIDRWGLELTELALRDPPAFERLLDALAEPEEGAVVSGPDGLLPGASRGLQQAVQ